MSCAQGLRQLFRCETIPQLLPLLRAHPPLLVASVDSTTERMDSLAQVLSVSMPAVAALVIAAPAVLQVGEGRTISAACTFGSSDCCLARSMSALRWHGCTRIEDTARVLRAMHAVRNPRSHRRRLVQSLHATLHCPCSYLSPICAPDWTSWCCCLEDLTAMQAQARHAAVASSAEMG